jgi:hypothetical protein
MGLALDHVGDVRAVRPAGAAVLGPVSLQGGPACVNPSSVDARSAIGDANGFKAEKKDVSGNEELFPDNPARRFSSKDGGTSSNRVKKANESDVSFRSHSSPLYSTDVQIEESDVEGA